MKALAYILSGLFTVLAVGRCDLAAADDNSGSKVTLDGVQTERVTRADVQPDYLPDHMGDISLRLNPVLGVSNLNYTSEGSAKPKVGGGALIEFGEGTYTAETGFLILQHDSDATFKGATSPTLIETNSLGIPLLGKVRVYNSAVQSWALKLGAIQTYELSSNKSDETNKIDVLASMGFTGRFAFTHRTDFVVDASYNRGLIPALKTAHADTFNEGVLLLAGVSFRL